MFCEKHGKSSRDQHFSVLTTFLKTAHITKQLKSTQDVIDALRIEQEKSNKQRLVMGLKAVNTKFLGNSLKTVLVFGNFNETILFSKMF